MVVVVGCVVVTLWIVTWRLSHWIPILNSADFILCGVSLSDDPRGLQRCAVLKTESLALRVTVPLTTTEESELPGLCSMNRLHAVLSMGKGKVQRLLPWYGPLAHSP